MRGIIEVWRFRRDVKLAQKRHKDLRKLKEAILFLVEEKTLPAWYRDHPLTGNWKDHWDLHLEPDWLLIYKVDGNYVHLVRTGTHSDLF